MVVLAILLVMLKTEIIRRYIWRWARKDCLSHDAFHCSKFSKTKPFPTRRILQPNNFVGAVGPLLLDKAYYSKSSKTKSFCAKKNNQLKFKENLLGVTWSNCTDSHSPNRSGDMWKKYYFLLPTFWHLVWLILLLQVTTDNYTLECECPLKCRPVAHKDWTFCWNTWYTLDKPARLRFVFVKVKVKVNQNKYKYWDGMLSNIPCRLDYSFSRD